MDAQDATVFMVDDKPKGFFLGVVIHHRPLSPLCYIFSVKSQVLFTDG
jgi:hypothetical protein